MIPIRRFQLLKTLSAASLGLIFLLSACDSNSSSSPPEDELAGGILATFDVTGESYRIWITNETAIEQVLALQNGESEANIPNGIVRRGPGKADHNEPYSWHIDPEQIQMAELTIEVCDGSPPFVEENLDEWIESVERYCPWNAELVAVEDFR